MDRLYKSGYLQGAAESMMDHCDVFSIWAITNDGRHRLIDSGTMCFVYTGRSTVGVTADHCYRGYLEYKANVGHDYREVYCQIGSLVIPRIEEHLCSRDAMVDLATFFISPILMEEIETCKRVNHYRPKKYHCPPAWPRKPLELGQAALFAGHLFIHPTRFVGPEQIGFHFYQFGIHPTDITDQNIVFALEQEGLSFYTPENPGEAVNYNLGGQSGGPVYRRPTEMGGPYELVGFIYEFSPAYKVLLARPVRYIDIGGRVLPLR